MTVLENLGISPAPWSACCLGTGKGCHYVFDSNGENSICHMSHNDRVNDPDNYDGMYDDLSVAQKDANARLISAAPEMLELLRLAVIGRSHVADNTYSSVRDYFDFLFKTVEKATGKTLEELEGTGFFKETD